MRPAITVSRLSKCYRVSHASPRHDTFTDLFTDFIRRPFRARPAEPPPDETFWALRDVDFEVKPGEVVGIVGRNGAGKSTLLKILSRITAPTAGRVELRGRVASLLEVGTGFHPELTGRENIYLNGSILGMKRAELDRKFDAIVDFAGVERFLDTPLKRYSSGMYVRLAFAVAAHLDPEILIVDEVLAVGDAEFQKKCLGTMKDAASQGRTVLLVSHNAVAVQSLCQRALLLDRGALVRDGAATSVVRAYLGGTGTLEAAIDLSAHPARHPRHEPTLAKLVLDATLANGRAAVGVGDDMVARVLVTPSAPLRHVSLRLGVSTVEGVRVFTVDSQLSGCELPLLEAPTWIDCRLPKLLLAPGRYALDLALFADGDEVDQLEPAAAFESLPQDVHGSGVLPSPEQGLLVQRASWHAALATESGAAACEPAEEPAAADATTSVRH